MLGKRQKGNRGLIRQGSIAAAVTRVNIIGYVARGAHHVTCQRLSDLLIVDGGLGLTGHLAGDGYGFINVQHHDLERRFWKHRAQLRRIGICSIPCVEVCIQVLDELNLQSGARHRLPHAFGECSMDQIHMTEHQQHWLSCWYCVSQLRSHSCMRQQWQGMPGVSDVTAAQRLPSDGTCK